MSSRPRADFFVLRAPLLALETLSRWAEGAQALTACADDGCSKRRSSADRTVLRAPPGGARGGRPDRRRPCTRLAGPRRRRGAVAHGAQHEARPLGRALAGPLPHSHGVAARPVRACGRLPDRAVRGGRRLELLPRSELEVRARVDSGLLRDVVRRAAAESAESPDIVVRRNPGVYRAGGRLRVAARKQGTTGHRLVQIRSTPQSSWRSRPRRRRCRSARSSRRLRQPVPRPTTRQSWSVV